jgi:sigma-B regulation protein RsbU (phosphoserine phosphatase)
VCRQREVQSLPATGLPVGLFAEAEYATHRLQLEPGDSLVLYTDGLSEARNPAGEEYGAVRMESVLRTAADADAAHLTAALLSDAATFRQGAHLNDDLTVMVVQRSTHPSASVL